MYTNTKFFLAAAPFILAAQALDVPIPCRDICGPTTQLDKGCDVSGFSDPDEKRMEDQCFCSNPKARDILPLCASCIHQNASPRGADDDNDNRAESEDVRDFDRLMATCRFSSTSYTPAATSLVRGIVVQATPLTAVNQLTTGTGGNTPRPTGSGGSGSRGSAQGSTRTNSAAGMKPLGGASAVGVLFGVCSLLAGILVVL